MDGEYKFNFDEREICGFILKLIFDYNIFDVILFCKFIKNFFYIKLKLIKGWENKNINKYDMKFGDDIMCIRVFKNKWFLYVFVGEFSYCVFEENWINLKDMF